MTPNGTLRISPKGDFGIYRSSICTHLRIPFERRIRLMYFIGAGVVTARRRTNPRISLIEVIYQVRHSRESTQSG